MITRNYSKPNLENLFFPVTEVPIYINDYRKGTKEVPGFKAIVDASNNHTFSVVTNKYRLVTNREAFKLADIVIQGVFPGYTLNDFEIFNVLMPKTKGSCRIDLIIPQSFQQPFGDHNDPWTPFLRITNSYNRTHVLKYEIGFCRWICKNGCIFGQKGYTFSISHSEDITPGRIEKWIEEARNSIGDIGDLWSNFQKKLIRLRDILIDDTILFSIYCKVFDIKIDVDKVTDIQEESYFERAMQIKRACKEYFEEMGNNAYALFNVLTDFASFPQGVNGASNYVHGYQRKVGDWIDSFLAEYDNVYFSWNKYVEEYVTSGFYLQTLILQTHESIK